MRKKSLLFALLLALFMPWVANAQTELTVCGGTANSQYIPFEGYNADNSGGQQNQMIYPATELTEMVGKTITQMKFYIDASANNGSYTAADRLGTWTISVGETNETTLTGLDNTTTLTSVYTGYLDCSTGTLTIPFETNYVYGGNNLLVQFYKAAGSNSGQWCRWYFLGETTSSNTSYGSYNSTHLWQFLPKNTFTYEVPACCPKPTLVFDPTNDVTYNSVTFSWQGDGECAYEVYDEATNEVVGNGSGINKPVTINGLQDGTEYRLELKAVCNECEDIYSQVVTATFRTPAMPQEPLLVNLANPFTDNFEGSLNWDLVNGEITNAWAVGNATYYGESGNALYISNDGGISNAYTNNSATLAFASKPLILEDGEYTFSYNWKGYGESSWDLMRVALVDAETVLTAGTNYNFIRSGLPEGWIALYNGTKLNLSNDWQSEDIDVSVEAGNYLMVFAWCNDGSGGTNPPAAVDNVSVTMVACPKPTNLAATNVTNHSATLGWTAAEGQNAWQIAYSTTSFDPNDPEFDLETVSVIDVEENTYTFEKNLDANTHYYMYVRGNCGEEDNNSKWVGVDFTTGVAAPSPTITTVDEITPYTAVLRWTSGGGDFLESYDIYYSTTYGQPTEESEIQYTGIDAGFTSYILQNLTDGYWYVYMRAYHGETDGYSSWNYYGYGFQVPEACPEPTGLTASDPTPNAITLTWTEGAEWQYAWKVAYSTDAEFNPEEMDPETFVEVFGQQGPTITCTVTGLEPATTYYFKVLGNCNNPYGDSEWTDAVSETTLEGCPVPFDLNVTVASNNATLGWTGYSDSYAVQYREAAYDEVHLEEDFEEDLGDWTFTSMNTANDIDATGSYYPAGINTSAAHSGEYSFRLSSYNRKGTDETYDQYLISPELTVADKLKFYANRYGTGDHLYVGVSSTTADLDAFTWGEDLAFASNNTWYEFTQELPEDVKYVAFHYFGDYAFYVYLDDITISTLVPAGDWVDAGTTTNTSMTLNLEYGKAYDARVMAECSDYSEPFNFATDALKRFTTEGDWNVADNWTPAGVPTINDDVTIEAAASITEAAYANNITIEGGSITIEDGGQLVHNNADVTATVKKHIDPWTIELNEGDAKADGWYFISNPLTTSITPSVENGLLAEGYDLYDWYATTDLEWHNYDNDDFALSYYNHPGYLYANENEVTLTFTGTVNSSNNRISAPAYYNSGASFGTWNLLGNPFVCNAYLVDNAGNALPFYKMNTYGDGYDAVEGQPIAPVEGIFYETSANSTVYFTREAPESKGGRLNMNLRRGNKQLDNAILVFGGNQQMGKFTFRENSSKIYMPVEGKDFAIMSAESNMGEMPVSFKAENNGSYTLSFNAEEVSFAYLHLIDNMTGTETDLLANPSYTFEAKTTDYASRFRLVFATGNADDDFAFFSNGSFVINNEGNATLQVIDITGRIINSESINGCANVNVNAAPGVYMLRLINGDNVKVQKVVVR